MVQSKLYLTDISKWEDAGRAHGEVFGEIRPTLSLVHVLPFLDPQDAGGNRTGGPEERQLTRLPGPAATCCPGQLGQPAGRSGAPAGRWSRSGAGCRRRRRPPVRTGTAAPWPGKRPPAPATSAAEYCSPGTSDSSTAASVAERGLADGVTSPGIRDRLGPLHRVLVQGPGLGQEPPVPGVGAELLRQRIGRERLQQVPQGAAAEGHPDGCGVRRRAEDHGVHVQLLQQVQPRGVRAGRRPAAPGPGAGCGWPAAPVMPYPQAASARNPATEST